MNLKLFLGTYQKGNLLLVFQMQGLNQNIQENY